MQGGLLYTHHFDYTGDKTGLSISAGSVFRWKDAIIPVVKLNTQKLSIGLSYDVNIRKLKTASAYRGGFEMVHTYMDFWKSGNSGAELVNCPTSIW